MTTQGGYFFEVIDYTDGVHARTPNGAPGLLHRFFVSADAAQSYIAGRPRARLAYQNRFWHVAFMAHMINNGHARFMRHDVDGNWTHSAAP